MSDLSYAIQAAVEAHHGQVDKQGKPYIFHCFRVMMAVPNNELMQMIAVMHDMKEDNPKAFNSLLQSPAGATWFCPEIVTAIDALSRRENEAWKDYIDRVDGNAVARVVKLADLKDNMRPMLKMTDKDYKRLIKYMKAYDRLSLPIQGA